MTTAFRSLGVWPEITKTVRASQKHCFAAVAYFSAGASKRLPLPKGSRLVVDASERAVSTGQTCPDDLRKLLIRGVAIYSVPNLHAKVFVVGKTAYIGSANVSNNSASQLIEAVIRTTDPGVITAAREFVNDHCLHELTPEVLKQLSTLYHPPKIPGGGGKGRPKGSSSRPALPRLLLAQLNLEDWSERDQQLHDKGLPVAEKRRQHQRGWEVDDFRFTGKCPYERGDVVIQVTAESVKRIMVTPPGNVLHVLRSSGEGNRSVSFVYLERPSRRRRSIGALSKALKCLRKQLLRNGTVRNRAFAQVLLNTWAVTS
jgi:hypothetical protein